jgi:FkbH-like protein
VCSKNNLADAQLPFQQHSGMKLRLDDFAAFKANWQDKASNIRDLAEELSLGLDSFVFLDDSPLEREWVRSQLPQVAVIEPGESIAGYISALDRGRFFFSLKLSKEDLARAESYRVAVAREQLRATAVSVDEFLAQLQLKAKVSSVTPSNLARITQLINKTNQFNVTTRRYTEALVESTAAAPENWVAAFSLEDRLGSYGLIGVMIARSGGQTLWEIDTWLMSCRVLGRQMEKFMFDRLVEAAAARGIREIAGIYHPTEKNVLVRDLYPQFGFTAVENGQGGQRYTFSLPKRLEPTATHVLQV